MRIIAGSARGRKLLSPVGMGTRPTLDRIKEAIFNIIQNRVRNAIVVDMFSGTGSLGLEAASRGAKHTYLFDSGALTYSILNENIKLFNFESICTASKMSCYEGALNLSKKGLVFDLIFIDPPYSKDMIPPAIELIEANNLLNSEGLIVTKVDSKEIIFEGSSKIKLTDTRKYGNTIVCFYKYKEV